MATIGTRLVRPILTLRILRLLTISQTAVRPMLSIRAVSATDTRMGFDSMNSLLFGADAFLGCLSADERYLPLLLSRLGCNSEAKPRRLGFTDLLEADSFLGEVGFEPIPEPNEEMGPIIL